MFKMYNRGMVVSGLLVFLAIVTFPFWKIFLNNMGKSMEKNSVFSSTSGSKENRFMPGPNINPAVAFALKSGVSGCVEDRNFMRARHMRLLDNWRDEVVRENKREYVNTKGEHFEKSLTGTCLKCHSNKEEFCDSCHKATGVEPYCFDCHHTTGVFSGNSAGDSTGGFQAGETGHLPGGNK